MFDDIALLTRLASCAALMGGKAEGFRGRSELFGQGAFIDGRSPVGRLNAVFEYGTRRNALAVDGFINFCIHTDVPLYLV